MSRLFRHLPILALLLPLAGLALLQPAPSPADDIKLADLPRIEKLTQKGYEEKLSSEVSLEMVPVPGGTFLMGSPKDEKGRGDDEGPQHAVTVRPFWMAKVETTWDLYDMFWKDNPGDKQEQIKAEKKKVNGKEYDALSRPTPPYGDPTFGFGHDKMPALSISHHAAMEFCAWLSRKTGKPYRLPTEAEWEWACRAGSKSAYPFGDDPEKLDEHAWSAKNSEESPHEVGKKAANAWGLHDLHGNLAEWCVDQYKADAYGTRPKDKPSVMPVLLPTADRWAHVVRGGSWADKAPALRSAARRGSDKSWIKQDPQQPKSIWWLTDGDFVGFRVMRPVEEHENLKGVRSQIKWASP